SDTTLFTDTPLAGQVHAPAGTRTVVPGAASSIARCTSLAAQEVAATLRTTMLSPRSRGLELQPPIKSAERKTPGAGRVTLVSRNVRGAPIRAQRSSAPCVS